MSYHICRHATYRKRCDGCIQPCKESPFYGKEKDKSVQCSLEVFK